MTQDTHLLLSAWRRIKLLVLRLSGQWRPLLEPHIAPLMTLFFGVVQFNWPQAPLAPSS